jgi:hypothetical protein
MQRADGLYPYFIDPTTGLKDFWATSSVMDGTLFCRVVYIDGRFCNYRSFWEIEEAYLSRQLAENSIGDSYPEGVRKCIVKILWGTGYEKSDAYDKMKRSGHFR